MKRGSFVRLYLTWNYRKDADVVDCKIDKCRERSWPLDEKWVSHGRNWRPLKVLGSITIDLINKEKRRGTWAGTGPAKRTCLRDLRGFGFVPKMSMSAFHFFFFLKSFLLFLFFYFKILFYYFIIYIYIFYNGGCPGHLDKSVCLYDLCWRILWWIWWYPPHLFRVGMESKLFKLN